jgi:hypothetical protein
LFDAPSSVLGILEVKEVKAPNANTIITLSIFIFSWTIPEVKLVQVNFIKGLKMLKEPCILAE